MTIIIYTQNWDKGLKKLAELIGEQELYDNHYTHKIFAGHQLSVYFDNPLLIKLILCDNEFSYRGLKYHQAWIDSNLPQDFINQHILPAGCGHWDPGLLTTYKGEEFYF